MLTLRWHAGKYPPGDNFPSFWKDGRKRIPNAGDGEGVGSRRAGSNQILRERAQAMGVEPKPEATAPPAVLSAEPPAPAQVQTIARPAFLPKPGAPEHFSLSDADPYGSLSEPTMTETDLALLPNYRPIARPKRAPAIGDNGPGSSTDRMALGDQRAMAIQPASAAETALAKPTSRVARAFAQPLQISPFATASSENDPVRAAAVAAIGAPPNDHSGLVP